MRIAEELGVEAEIVLYQKTPPDRAALEHIVSILEDPVTNLVRRDAQWTKLGLTDADAATPEQVIGPDRRIIDVLCGKEEQHISADIAYAVWQYWQATADEGFLCAAGATGLSSLTADCAGCWFMDRAPLNHSPSSTMAPRAASAMTMRFMGGVDATRIEWSCATRRLFGATR